MTPRHGTHAHEHFELLRWVADLYYLQQQGQADIAALIGVSVSKVSRLLAEARRQGVVTIQVADSRVGDSDFERLLARQLGLQAVYVAPARVADTSTASRIAAVAAPAHTLPPAPTTPTSANCEAPVNISTDRAHVWSSDSPAAVEIAPNEIA